MNRIPFYKYEALGNDFMILDAIQEPTLERVIVNSEWIREVSHRSRGVGFDQLCYLEKDFEQEANLKVRFFNQDGSESGMCGNGLRAIALYLRDYGHPHLKARNSYTIKLQDRMVDTKIDDQNLVTVDLGEPKFIKKEELSFEDFSSDFIHVDVGNPHAVFFQKPEAEKMLEWSQKIEKHSFFPKKTNVEWVSVLSEKEIDLIVWERGAGYTLACGSGACAAVIAGITEKKLSSHVQVHLPGGDVWVTYEPKTESHSSVYLKGEAKFVYYGEWGRR